MKQTYARVAGLEKQLHDTDMPEEKKKMIRQELEEVRKLLATNESQLAHLRTHNRKSFLFIVCLLFICFTLYVLYVLLFGPDVNN